MAETSNTELDMPKSSGIVVSYGVSRNSGVKSLYGLISIVTTADVIELLLSEQ